MASRRFYIVRLRADDSIVAVGSDVECAKMMGMALQVFRCTVSHCLAGRNKKYEIDILPELEE